MKKLESLNNSLFEKFENNKVNNLALCFGGEKKPTYHGGVANDSYDLETNNGATIYLTPGSGSSCDYVAK